MRLPHACPGLQELRAAWKALEADPWVISTMYRLQFMSKPPLTRQTAFSIVADPQHREALRSDDEKGHQEGEAGKSAARVLLMIFPCPETG